MAGRSLMHNLGCFFGEIAKGFRSRPDKHATRYEIHRSTQERHRTDQSEQSVTLRRTTIEEVEYNTTPPTESHHA